VHRISASLNQLKGTVEPAFAADDFERRSRFEVERRHARDVRKEQVRKGAVIGDIEKNTVARRAPPSLTFSS